MDIGPSNGSLADVAHIQILSEVESNAHIVNMHNSSHRRATTYDDIVIL